MSEADLDVHLPDIAQGDAQAFARWMSGAEPALRASLRRFAKQVDAEAVLQETLLRAWQVAPRMRPDGRPNALLRMSHRIGTNLAISEIRRRGGRAAPPPDDVAVSPSLPDPMLREVIARCREKLPPKPAQALDARLGAQGGVHDSELAAGLGLKKNTFLQSFGRARKLLKACLEKNGVRLSEVLA